MAGLCAGHFFLSAPVSDVQVLTIAMRRTALLHGVVSFFFYVVFIAMAVNAGVALAARSVAGRPGQEG